MQSLHKQVPPCCNKTRISLSQWSRFWWLFTIIIVIIITIITIGMCAWWHRVSQWLVTKERNKVSGSQSSQPYNLTATGDQSTTLYDTHYTICTIQPMNKAHYRIYSAIQYISKSVDTTMKDRLWSAHCTEGNIPMHGIDWENREGSSNVILGGGPLAWLGH